VSGNVEALDFDRHDIFITFGEIIVALGYGDLFDRVRDGYQDRTPNGVHLLWRCDQIAGNQKLASTYDRDETGTIKRTPQGKPLTKTLIETRGEGGFLVIPPSHGRTHPSGKPYVQVSGGLATIATISPAERDILIDVACSLNEVFGEIRSDSRSQTKQKASGGTRPGDLFTARATWEEILEPHGWRQVFERAGVSYWRRPGKDQGISATTNYAGSDLFYVFSTSTDFDSERGYSKFSAYTFLNHGGNFEKAAEDLLRQGYYPTGKGGSQYSNGASSSTNDTRQEATARNHDPIIPLWPELEDAALNGLAGDIVNTIAPFTEADKVAVLLNVLIAFGNCINAAPHARVQHDNHPPRLFVVQVGDTSKGRKGTGWSTPRYLFSLCDEDWSKTRVKSGLSSGEGLIYNVRDPRYVKVPRKEKGKFTGDYDEVCVDEGETDKRLLVVEPEFASVLTVANREGSTLSEILRQAWDSGALSPMTKNNPIKATGAHISLIAHVTKQELLARLDDTSKANGFANRFLWALVKRSKELPEGGAVPDALLLPLAERLSGVITFSRTVSEVKRDDEAKALWAEVYHDLSEGKPGLLGAVLSRAEAQVLRMSVIYALLNKSNVVRVEHLRAALAIWEYCERSAVLIFGERLGDPTADRILEAIRAAGSAGMSANDIYELFGKHKSANDRARAVNLLLSLGLIRVEEQGDTGGRPRTVYKAA
jgi:hypothetical protein